MLLINDLNLHGLPAADYELPDVNVEIDGIPVAIDDVPKRSVDDLVTPVPGLEKANGKRVNGFPLNFSIVHKGLSHDERFQ